MIGENVQRIDAYEKVTGKAIYTTDLPARKQHLDLAFIKALRSPYAHANIVSLDTSDAERLPGVVCVVTGNEPGVNWKAFPHQARIARKEVIWAGQAVALVVAESEEIAESALALISIEYEPLAHVSDLHSSFVENPASVVDPAGLPGAGPSVSEFALPNVSGAYFLNHGDADAAMQNAAVVVEGTFFTGKKTHSQLERAAVLIELTSDGCYEIYCNGCGVHAAVKKNICDAFSIPENRVRVVQPYTGGSFGNRNIAYIEVPAMLAALKAKRSVYYEFSRKEMFTAAPSNWACGIKVKLAADKTGRLLGKEIRFIEEIGATPAPHTYTGRLSSSSTACVYQMPATRMNTCAVLTNTVPAGSYRGLGAPDASFAMESMIDELAEKLSVNPVELRLKNIIKNGETDDYGEVITSIGVKECLISVSEAIDLNTPSTQDIEGWIKAKGVACAGKQNGQRSRSEAAVKVYSDGSIELFISCDNHGMGASTALAQIVANEFGISVDCIKVVIADTAITPFDDNSSSSTGIYRTGNAVMYASRDAIAQLSEAAARMAGVHVDKVKIKGGFARIVGSAKSEIPLIDLFQDVNPFHEDIWGLKKGSAVIGRGVYNSSPLVKWDENGRTPRMWNWFQYAATGVEIAVQPTTGRIRVLKVANACDSGNPINPKIVEGQLDGGAHMAIGFCLTEEHLYNEHGEISNANFSDYRLPTILDMPTRNNVKAIICPDPLPDGPYGAKGMSESVVSAVGPAIAAALYKAVGVRMRSYPMTPEQVLKAIRKK